MNINKAKMKSNYNLLESNYSRLESSYRMLEFDSGNALFGRRIASAIGGGFANVSGVQHITPYQDKLDSALIAVEETFDMCMGQSVVVKYQNKLYTSYKNIVQKNNPEPAFYYLSDHLGSSSYITDGNGNVTQAFAYLPFGEQWVDLQYGIPSYTTPYKFNGKERDEETGYTYYNQRYYLGSNDKTPFFGSVDPLCDMFPHQSPYAYCSNNPVNRTDPTGMADDWVENKETNQLEFMPEVTSPSNTPEGYEYVGKEGFGKNEGGYSNYYGKDGSITPYTQDLGTLEVNADAISKESGAGSILATTFLIAGGLAADDVTGIGVADDPLIPVIVAGGLLTAGAVWIYDQFKEHDSNVSKSKHNKHTKPRSGGDPVNGRYGKQRNDNRGDKNTKFIPKSNPNKRKK